MKYTLLVVAVFLMRGCGIGAVDYAVGNVRLSQKQKTSVDNLPAVLLTVENAGQAAADDIVVTVKAKQAQKDIDTAVVRIESLPAGSSVTRTAILRRLKSHADYELLTYAVSYQQ